MGDGTTKAALKGSPKGRRQSRQPCPGTPARHGRRGNRAAAWRPARPQARVPAFAVLPRAAREGQVGVSSAVPGFLQRRLSGSFGK